MFFKTKIINFFNKLNYYFGRKFFRNFNPLSYNLFNLIYKKNISNKFYFTNNFISSYHKLGFAKLGRVDDQNINKLLISLKKNNPNIYPGSSFSYNYKIEKDTMEIIKKIIDLKLTKKLEVLERYYNLKIALVHLKITRNYYDPNSNFVENYSNFFHSDGYLFNLFKIFINLEDVDESKGPLTIVKKEKSKEFINFYSYDKRKYCSIVDQTDNFFYKNLGQKGDVFLCNTTELLHKAGEIEKNKSRDMLFLEFVAYPFENSIHLYSFENMFDSSLDKKFAKIKGIKNLINLYFACKKNKLN
jgi:hypothetical protein